MMSKTFPGRGAHPALKDQVIFIWTVGAACASWEVKSFFARSQLRREILKKHECHSPAPQMLRGKMFKGIFPIKQPAPNIACSGWWGVCAFLGRLLALGFLRFDSGSALRPTATNADRWGADLRNRESFYISMKNVNPQTQSA
jgi:hypothetical protein